MVNVADESRDGEPAHGTPAGHAAPGAKPAVLVVDDEAGILHLARSVLGARFDVLCAHDTREADALLREHPVRVIVCDHHMPGENGLDFLVRTRQTYPLIPRVLLTGCDDRETILAAINRGSVLRYLVKPVQYAALREAVDEAVSAHAAAARSATLGRENTALRDSLRRLVSLSRPVSLRETPLRALVGMGIGLLLVLAVALLLGLLVFVILYAVKSALGIDLISDWHLSDAW